MLELCTTSSYLVVLLYAIVNKNKRWDIVNLMWLQVKGAGVDYNGVHTKPVKVIVCVSRGVILYEKHFLFLWSDILCVAPCFSINLSTDLCACQSQQKVFLRAASLFFQLAQLLNMLLLVLSLWKTKMYVHKPIFQIYV